MALPCMRRLLRYRRCVSALVLSSFILSITVGGRLLIHLQHSPGSGLLLMDKMKKEAQGMELDLRPDPDPHNPGHPLQLPDDILPFQDVKDHEEGDDIHPEPNYDVHAFYYIWYANPEHDGKYLHWNHDYLPHWNPRLAHKWPLGRHKPPEDIGSNYYPELGPYSSRDPVIMENHMQQLRTAAIGVISVSWYPPGQGDDQGEPIDPVIAPLLDAAQKYNIKVCIHVEPYKGRDAISLRKNIQYVLSSYGNHPAFYRRRHKNKNLPMFYIYDSYNLPKEEWARLFTLGGDLSIRNTNLDGIFIGLLVETKHRQDLTRAGFDGYYTYFSSNGFSYGSNSANWRNLARDAAAKNQIFIPSVGPGYVDDRIRPWNTVNTKERDDGQYYEKYFKAAMDVQPPIISITSFNEWGEGSQIETAVRKTTAGYTYLDYSPHTPDYYLTLTCKCVLKYTKLLLDH